MATNAPPCEGEECAMLHDRRGKGHRGCVCYRGLTGPCERSGSRQSRSAAAGRALHCCQQEGGCQGSGCCGMKPRQPAGVGSMAAPRRHHQTSGRSGEQESCAVYTSRTALMQPSFSGLLVTCAGRQAGSRWGAWVCLDSQGGPDSRRARPPPRTQQRGHGWPARRLLQNSSMPHLRKLAPHHLAAGRHQPQLADVDLDDRACAARASEVRGERVPAHLGARAAAGSSAAACAVRPPSRPAPLVTTPSPV